MERTSHTAEASTVHKPLGRPGGPGLFHHKGLQLPAYIQSVAQHLVAAHGESRAIEMAVGIVRDWAHGHDGRGNKVHPDVQAAAAKAMAQWEADKASSGKARRSAVTVTRAQMTTQDINDLPDSDFAFIESGGSKDASGKTVPRSLRHFPVHDAAHIRNALARLPQSDLSPEQQAQAMRKIRARAQKAGVEAGGGDSGMSRWARAELFRSCPLEDYHIVRTGEGDRSGRVVEAYMTVFGEPAEIRDHQGHYEEDIDRAAFNKRIADLERSRNGFAAAKVFYNHGMTIHGSPSDRYSMPVAVCESIRAESRGPITRSRYLDTPLGNEVLEMWRSGAVTAQSFTGAIIRSDPQLRPGEKYRPQGGRLPRVRRLELGLKEFGPTPFPAYQGAELVGVRMSPLGTWQDGEDDEELYDDVALPPDEEAAAGGPPDVHPTREHAHRLWQMRTEELCRQAGIAFKEP